MKDRTIKSGAIRNISLILAVLMIFSLVPQGVFAAPSVSLQTNKDTYEVGEGILVTATSDTAWDWVGIYKKGESPSATTSYYWYYVNNAYDSYSWSNGKTYNIFYTACNSREGIADCRGVPAGEYDIILMAEDYTVKTTKTISVVEPQEKPESSISSEKSSFELGQPVNIMATSYNSGSWVGIYSGTK